MNSSLLETKQLNILAVDDEAGSRTLLSIMLKLTGNQALFANGGEEALKLVESTPVPFDLIITDHNMPGMSGLDLARRLRERKFAGEICVMTGFVGPLEKAEYKKLGISGIMEKPFRVGVLRDFIQYCRER